MTSLLLLKSMLFASLVRKSAKRKKLKAKKSLLKTIDLRICRICAKEKGKISIFNNDDQLNISDEIKNFSGVTITQIDNLPKSICQKCLNLLNGCINFRNLCQRTNKRLLDLTIKKESLHEVDILQSEDPFENQVDICKQSEDSYDIPSPTFSEDNSGLWSCSACSNEFSDLVSYNDHLTKCNAPDIPKHAEVHKKTFLCDICGKTARSNANLLVHMGTHENVFPFKCDSCPYQGRTMDLLKVHKRSHLIDKPYKCTHCSKATTTSSNLAKHIRHVHSTNRPYKCNYCEKAFSYQHDMKRHVKDIHLRQGTVECDVCFKKFNTKKILQGHRWKIHKIKGERHGRLPSYLQCQIDEPHDNNIKCDSSL